MTFLLLIIVPCLSVEPRYHCNIFPLRAAIAIYSKPFSDTTIVVNFLHVSNSYICARRATSGVTGKLVDGTDNNEVANAGETLTRTYHVTNGGTTTLSSICVTDEKIGAECLECTMSDDDELLPGEVFVCSVRSVVSCFRLGQLSPPLALF